MSLLTPAGLIALIGVPIIIIIYIFRSKFIERQVGSTFIWKLSRRFRKNKLPISKINKFFSFISLILMVVLISLILSKPLITLPENANEYIVVVDTSLSMSVGKENDQRIDRANKEVKKLIDNMEGGSVMSILVGSKSPYVLINKESNKTTLKAAVDSIKCSNDIFNQNDALSLASNYTNNAFAKLYLVTDKDYETVENIELINVSYDTEWNASIVDASFKTVEEKLNFEVTVASYNKSEEMTLTLYNEDKIVTAKKTKPNQNEETVVTFEVDPFDFEDVKITLNAKDDLACDNEYHIYKDEQTRKKVLIAGTQTFFIQSAMSSISDAQIDVVDSLAYENGYDLYIFDNALPEKLPNDGAVLVINPSRSGDDYLCNYQELKVTDGGNLSINESSKGGTAFDIISPKLLNSGIQVRKILKSSPKSSSEIVLKVNSNAALVAGKQENGNRVVSILFDLHESNLPISPSFITLFKGIYDYLLPTISAEAVYECGDTAKFSLLPSCRSISIDSPDGEKYKVKTDGDYFSFTLDALGTYIIKEDLTNTWDKTIKVWVKAPTEESNISFKGPSCIVELSSKIKEEKIYKTIDLIPFLLIGLISLVVLEWGLYSYENR